MEQCWQVSHATSREYCSKMKSLGESKLKIPLWKLTIEMHWLFLKEADMDYISFLKNTMQLKQISPLLQGIGSGESEFFKKTKFDVLIAFPMEIKSLERICLDFTRQLHALCLWMKHLLYVERTTRSQVAQERLTRLVRHCLLWSRTVFSLCTYAIHDVTIMLVFKITQDS